MENLILKSHKKTITKTTIHLSILKFIIEKKPVSVNNRIYPFPMSYIPGYL